MNFLYSRNNAKFHVVLSGQNCPDFYAGILPTTLNTIPYTPTAIAQNGDWFKVDLSSLADVTNPILELDKKVNTSLPTITAAQYRDIKYLIFKRQNDDFYYIQKVLPSAKIYRKTLSFSNQPKVLNHPIVILELLSNLVYGIQAAFSVDCSSSCLPSLKMTLLTTKVNKLNP